MTIEEAIKRSGTTNIFAKASTKKAQSLIENDEEILYAINTDISDKDSETLTSLTDLLNGVVAITNKRILFCSSIIGNTTIKQILIQDITSMNESIHGLTKIARFTIQGITETIIIYTSKSRIIDELRSYIYKIQQTKIIENNNKNINLSIADEIYKFKKLLDEGIITNEEFERKKQELLK